MTPQEVLQCISQLRPNNTFYFDGECTIDNIVWDSDDVTLPTTSEMEEHWKVVSGIRFTKELRQERNQRLADVDWVFSEDYSIDDDSYQQWLAYRKALRDLPSATEDPENPVWPEKPAIPSGTTENKDPTRELRIENNRLKSKVTILENRQTHFNTLLVNLIGRVETLERPA
jgi:hypothetical protein